LKSGNRVYELRSYESEKEVIHANKVNIFNAGGESLFNRLEFNAVFYGSNFGCQDAKPNVHDLFQIRKVEMPIGKLFQL
jgi:hypothetical protein